MTSSPQVSLREIYHIIVVAQKPNGKIQVLGRIDDVLFDMHELRAVGFSVKRIGLMGFLRRKPFNIALDALDPALCDEDEEALALAAGAKVGRPPADAGSGFDWERTLILYGLPVYTTEYEHLGKVSDALVRWDDGRLAGLEVSSGTASDATLGKRTLPASYVQRFLEATDEATPHVLLVDPASKRCAYAGGLASLAGKASGKMNAAAEKLAVQAGAAAGHVANAASNLASAARPVASKAGDAAVTAAAKAAVGTQRAAQKVISGEAGEAAKKHVAGLWSGFSEGYRSGLHGPDDD